MKFLKFLMLSIITMLFALITISGCSQKAEEASTQKESSETKSEAAAVRSIKHELGETELQGIPERIVTLEYSFVDSLAALGVTPVGIADDDNPESIILPIKEKLGKYTSVGSRYEVNFELISSLKPDLIIGDISRHKEVFDKLQTIAPTILLKSHGATYSENLSSFPVIAEAVGKSDVAQKRIKEHEEELAELQKKIPQNESSKVLPAVVNSKGFYAHTSKAYAGSLLEEIGLKNAIESDEAYPQLTLEQLVEFNPDVLFLMKGEEATVVDEWSKNPLWETITAVENGQVYEVDRTVWSLSRGLISAETIVDEALNLLYE